MKNIENETMNLQVVRDTGEIKNDKESIIIPKGIRYVGELGADGKVTYKLSDYPYPHILNKVLTGCGFTEYCIRNDMNIILCSPRKMLLENKEEQHPEINVYYAKNESEVSINYERAFTIAEGRKAIRKHLSILELLKQKAKMTPEQLKKEEEENKKRIQEYKDKIKDHYRRCLYNGFPCKVLVTYDSFRHVKDALQEINALDNFQVVVDEFQSILVDCKFKSDTEMELMYHLSDIQKVCYVSATPMLDKYIKMLDEFKDLPYFEFDWVTEDPSRIIKPVINTYITEKIPKEAIKVIYSYKDGKFEKESKINDQGLIEEVESKEAVLYVNSVSLICSLITKCELTPDQCNILIARTKDNETKIRKAFNDVRKKLGLGKALKPADTLIGTVPTKGEQHKMFTFCTRTVYLGADFYSTNARTFIFCDSNIDCLSVDISMDLPQIMGRQRLTENPWKNIANVYIKSTTAHITRAEFERKLDEKIGETKDLLNVYGRGNGSEKHTLAGKYERDAIGSSYSHDYVAVNRHAGSDLVPVFNKLMFVSEERAFDIQQQDYADRVSIFNTLQKKGFSYIDITSELGTFNSFALYSDKMKFICNQSLMLNPDKFGMLINSVPKSFKNYFTVLGPAKCKAHKYQKGEMEKEYQRLLNNQGVSLDDRVYDAFHAGERIKKTDIKKALEKIYQDSNFQQTAKAVDISQWFNVKPVKINDPAAGKRVDGFELISRITPPTP